MSDSTPISPPSEHPSIAPTTTAQEDITLAGQRRINIIWEVTQAIIAIVVVFANMLPPLISMMNGKPLANTPEAVTNTLFLVIGFYFSRTNHAAIGGTGNKPEGKYTGR